MRFSATQEQHIVAFDYDHCMAFLCKQHYENIRNKAQSTMNAFKTLFNNKKSIYTINDTQWRELTHAIRVLRGLKCARAEFKKEVRELEKNAAKFGQPIMLMIGSKRQNPHYDFTNHKNFHNGLAHQTFLEFCNKRANWQYNPRVTREIFYSCNRNNTYKRREVYLPRGSVMNHTISKKIDLGSCVSGVSKHNIFAAHMYDLVDIAVKKHAGKNGRIIFYCRNKKFLG